MYIDSNVGGVLFQALAAVLAALIGVVFVVARQVRYGFVRIRRHHRKVERISLRDDQAGK